MPDLNCPICRSVAVFFTKNPDSRNFFQCTACHYVFEPEDKKLIGGREEEEFFRGRWKNAPEGGYQECYPLLFSLMSTCGENSIEMLDFGCGDGGLIRQLRQKGVPAMGVDRVPVENDMKPHVVRSLDDLKGRRFMVITLIEVFEHLHNPMETLEALSGMLMDTGFFFITTQISNRALMTLRYFPFWVYQTDKTHVGFFHEKTLDYMARRLGLDLQIIGTDKIVMDKTFNRIIIPQDGRYVFARDKGGDFPVNWPLHKPDEELR